jgi:hypothetical protein
VQFELECDLVPYENKVETTKGIHMLNLLGENNLEGVQKPSQKDQSLINVICVGMLAQRN